MTKKPIPMNRRYTPPMAKFKGTNANLREVPTAKSRSSRGCCQHPERRKVLYVLGGSLLCVMIIGALFAIPIVLVIELTHTTTTTSTVATVAASTATSGNASTTSSSVNANGSNTTAITTTTYAATTNICLNMTCAFSSIASPMTSTYGVEHLNINCSESVSSMFIQIVVQRTVNASYANQYQTFWNLTTNQTYIETSTQIIYTWTLLNAQIVNGIGFPYFVEGQYFLSGINQTTNLDTYSATLTSVCGNTISQNGTF